MLDAFLATSNSYGTSSSVSWPSFWPKEYDAKYNHTIIFATALFFMRQWEFAINLVLHVNIVYSVIKFHINILCCIAKLRVNNLYSDLKRHDNGARCAYTAAYATHNVLCWQVPCSLKWCEVTFHVNIVCCSLKTVNTICRAVNSHFHALCRRLPLGFRRKEVDRIKVPPLPPPLGDKTLTRTPVEVNFVRKTAHLSSDNVLQELLQALAWILDFTRIRQSHQHTHNLRSTNFWMSLSKQSELLLVNLEGSYQFDKATRIIVKLKKGLNLRVVLACR